ncbi:MarR family transcriptional regulator [Halorubrum sp. GN11_10-6_MGM]|uniref:MarR family transcriptional regulator n=1 Tax=Halorubrum sp. GN11_10-6_MGM TaxID=2518112 RepID=UPI0010F6A7F2|nr:MarR family transcriptional regulator [Halorubrum sp. GN11_10-6_MGM]
MRYSADWMTIADERILEYLSTTETSTPKKMADSGDVRFSRQYIGERCRKLADYRMVQHLGNGVYRITETGGQYLDGDLDAADLESNSQ